MRKKMALVHVRIGDDGSHRALHEILKWTWSVLESEM